MIPPHLSHSGCPLHIDPKPFPVPEDPAQGTLSVDVFLCSSNLLPLAAVIETMNDAGAIAQERALDVRFDNHFHPDLLPG